MAYAPPGVAHLSLPQPQQALPLCLQYPSSSLAPQRHPQALPLPAGAPTTGTAQGVLADAASFTDASSFVGGAENSESPQKPTPRRLSPRKLGQSVSVPHIGPCAATPRLQEPRPSMALGAAASSSSSSLEGPRPRSSNASSFHSGSCHLPLGALAPSNVASSNHGRVCLTRVVSPFLDVRSLRSSMGSCLLATGTAAQLLGLGPSPSPQQLLGRQAVAQAPAQVVQSQTAAAPRPQLGYSGGSKTQLLLGQSGVCAAARSNAYMHGAPPSGSGSAGFGDRGVKSGATAVTLNDTVAQAHAQAHAHRGVATVTGEVRVVLSPRLLPLAPPRRLSEFAPVVLDAIPISRSAAEPLASPTSDGLNESSRTLAPSRVVEVDGFERFERRVVCESGEKAEEALARAKLLATPAKHLARDRSPAPSMLSRQLEQSQQGDGRGGLHSPRLLASLEGASRDKLISVILQLESNVTALQRRVDENDAERHQDRMALQQMVAALQEAGQFMGSFPREETGATGETGGAVFWQ